MPSEPPRPSDQLLVPDYAAPPRRPTRRTLSRASFAALAAALAFGGLCLFSAAWVVMGNRGRTDEFGVTGSPNDRASALWLLIATAVFALAVGLFWKAVRRMRS